MNKTTALAFMLFLTSLAASQNVPMGQPDAQCKFSDGKNRDPRAQELSISDQWDPDNCRRPSGTSG